MRGFYLDQAERNPIDEQHEIDPDRRTSRFARSIFGRHLESVCPPAGPLDELEWPFARGSRDRLWESNPEHQVISHSLVCAHYAFGNPIHQSAYCGINIGLGKCVRASVGMDPIDSREIGTELDFQEGLRPSSVAPLIGLGARNITPAAIDQCMQRLELSTACF